MNPDHPHRAIPLESILVSADIGIWQYDHAADILTHNLAFVAAAGLAPAMDECSLDTWLESVHPEDKARVRAGFGAAMTPANQLSETEYRLRRADQGWLWVHARGRTLERDEAGRPLRSAGTVIDIGGRKQAEFLLQIQHEFAGFLLAGPDRDSLLTAILRTALRLPGLDSGGLSLLATSGRQLQTGRPTRLCCGLCHPGADPAGRVAANRTDPPGPDPVQLLGGLRPLHRARTGPPAGPG
jgi:PAS domain S-box-containing protein